MFQKMMVVAGVSLVIAGGVAKTAQAEVYECFKLMNGKSSRVLVKTKAYKCEEGRGRASGWQSCDIDVKIGSRVFPGTSSYNFGDESIQTDDSSVFSIENHPRWPNGQYRGQLKGVDVDCRMVRKPIKKVR